MAGNVRVLFFANAREIAGCSERSVVCDNGGLSDADFWHVLSNEFPKLATLKASIRLARNHEYLAAGELIKPGDEVALIPPVSGG